MFNVLPDVLKGEVKSEYKIRRLIIVCLAVMVIELSCLVFLFPSWIISSSKQKEIQGLLSQIQDSAGSKNADSIYSVIALTNKKLRILDTSLVYPNIIPLSDSILSKKTSGIRITQFEYSSVGKNGASLILEGIATTRETLVAFVRDLKTVDAFKSVDLPVSNLAKEKDLEFTVSIGMK